MITDVLCFVHLCNYVFFQQKLKHYLKDCCFFIILPGTIFPFQEFFRVYSRAFQLIVMTLRPPLTTSVRRQTPLKLTPRPFCMLPVATFSSC